MRLPEAGQARGGVAQRDPDAGRQLAGAGVDRAPELLERELPPPAEPGRHDQAPERVWQDLLRVDGAAEAADGRHQLGVGIGVVSRGLDPDHHADVAPVHLEPQPPTGARRVGLPQGEDRLDGRGPLGGVPLQPGLALDVVRRLRPGDGVVDVGEEPACRQLEGDRPLRRVVGRRVDAVEEPRPDQLVRHPEQAHPLGDGGLSMHHGAHDRRGDRWQLEVAGVQAVLERVGEQQEVDHAAGPGLLLGLGVGEEVRHHALDVLEHLVRQVRDGLAELARERPQDGTPRRVLRRALNRKPPTVHGGTLPPRPRAAHHPRRARPARSSAGCDHDGVCHYCGCRQIPLLRDYIAEHERATNLADHAVRAIDSGDLPQARRCIAEMAAVLEAHWRGEENGLFRIMARDEEVEAHIIPLVAEHRELAGLLASANVADPEDQARLRRAIVHLGRAHQQGGGRVVPRLAHGSHRRGLGRVHRGLAGGPSRRQPDRRLGNRPARCGVDRSSEERDARPEHHPGGRRDPGPGTRR